MKKHILCLGDSNTHGYCADPNDCADHGIRFNEDERWTCRLQKALGEEYLVTEEGLSGRTTVFVDPLHESMDALSVAYALLKSHEVIDLLIIMLGTNDVKERFGANAACIGAGMERLLLKVKSVDCWGGKAPNILVVAPPCIKDGFHDAVMGAGCVEKSRGVAEQLRIVAERQGVHFMDAAECEFNEVDFFHDSGGFKNASQDPSKSRCNKTKENDTEMSETDPFNSEEADGMSKRTQLEEYFSQSLEIDLLLRLCPDDKDIIYQIVDLLVDTCATNRKLLHIAGDDKPAEVVRSRFMKLNADHIRFVLKCLAENSSPIRNMKQYLLASLYNAPTTMQLSYQNQTNHDLANRR